MRKTLLVLWTLVVLAPVVVAACGGAAASSMPSPESAPQVRVLPTEDPGVDPDTVIATVAGHDITVREFRNRVRYERWLALETVRRVIALSGFEEIDINDQSQPLTPTLIGYLYTLSEAEAFAGRVLEFMIQDYIIHQEFVDRELDPNTALYNNLWLRLMNIEPAENGGLPPDLEVQRAALITALSNYTDFSEQDLSLLLTVRSEQQTVAQLVGEEVEFDPVEKKLRHILVETEAEANEIIALLEEGADFTELAHQRSIDPDAQGDGGALGFFGRGQMVAPFEEAAFSAAPGDIVGPVQTEFGYHVIEVLDHEVEHRLRLILIPSQENAEAALDRLANGEDFAAVAADMAIQPGAVTSGGDLGYLSLEQMPPAVADAVSVAAIGDVIGPLESDEGFNIVQVTERRPVRVHARHILLETEAEAIDVLERLNAGEDFARLAHEVSIDPGAQGDGGELGFVPGSMLPEALAEAINLADINEIVGPVETALGFHVAQVTDTQLNMISTEEYDDLKAVHFQNWLREAIETVAIDEIWRDVYPSDPQPADVDPYLGELYLVMQETLRESDIIPSPGE